MAIGQCRSGGITVATVALAHGVDNAVLGNENSGGYPLYHMLKWSVVDIYEKQGFLSLINLACIDSKH